MHRLLVYGLPVLLAAGCGSNSFPTAPSNTAHVPPSTAVVADSASTMVDHSGPGAGVPRALPSADAPDRADSLRFRQWLEGVYQGSTQSPTQVDIEGAIVWTQEFVYYWRTGCPETEATSRTLTAIDRAPARLAGPPGCGGSAGFPGRDIVLRFRSGPLESRYRSEGRSVRQSNVNVEGDAIWTLEYLRFRIGDCSHQEALDRIHTDIDAIRRTGRGNPQPVCATITLPIVPAGPTAIFTIVPNPGTGVAANGTQCAVSQATVAGQLRNVLACRFDGSASMPVGQIDSYRWSIQGQDSATPSSGQQLTNVHLPCGLLGGATTVDRTVSLTVTSGAGSHTSAPRTLTLVKQGPC